MTPSIQINLFSTRDRRFPIAFGNLDQLSKVNPSHLNRMILKIFCYRYHEEQWKKKMETSNIPFQLCPMPSPGETVGYAGYDYKERTKICIESECKYSIRIDDDQFISTPLWNFMFNTIDEVLSQERVHAYCPVSSTSIPSIDFFVEDFLSEKDKETIKAIFKKAGFPGHPGFPDADYTHVQKAIENMERWDSVAYWKAVLNPPTTRTFHPTIFQSIHPILFSVEANAFLTERIFSNFNKIMEEQEYECIAVYGMPNNHWACTRTSNWKRAILEFGANDPFDELAMQCNERKYEMSTVYIKQGFAIHPCLGYVPNREKIDEQYAAFISKIGDSHK